MNMLSNIIFIVFAVVIVYYGQDIALRILELGQESPALHIPMGIVYLATPVGMGLTVIRLVQQLIKQGKALVGKESFEVELEHEKTLDDQEDLVNGADKEHPDPKS